MIIKISYGRGGVKFDFQIHFRLARTRRIRVRPSVRPRVVYLNTIIIISVRRRIVYSAYERR